MKPPALHLLIVGVAVACTVGDKAQTDTSKVAASSSVAVSAANSASAKAPLGSSTPPASATRIEPELPVPMRRALDAYAPGFRRFAASEYAERQDTTYRAEGDFNGDGIGDVALYGHDDSRELLLVILSEPDSVYRIVPIEDRPLILKAHEVFIALSTQSPGPLDIPDELKEADTPKRLQHAAINVLYGQEAGELYYWKGDHFAKVATGD
jgi:hypothetical protein